MYKDTAQWNEKYQGDWDLHFPATYTTFRVAQTVILHDIDWHIQLLGYAALLIFR